jgi:tRNA-specific 2-thiouridylase
MVPHPGRVAVGMSGGIDSSVAAALLAERGHEVIGLSLHMFKEGSRCCSLEDVNRARRVCDALGIRHYVMNVVDEFRESIIRPFADEYARGRTPNPCIWCNRDFKFGAMLRRALQLDCTHVATGHYVRVEHRADGYHLLRGTDTTKDQSYFLHRLSQEQLAHALFPLGAMAKAQVRASAASRNLPVEGARETADLCFITAAGPAPLVESLHPEIRRDGEIRDSSGNAVGHHRGIHYFTVGQRSGLGVALGAPRYVKELRPDENVVVIAERSDVLADTCQVNDLFWTTPSPPDDGADCQIRLRYRHEGVAARLKMLDTMRCNLTFQKPQFAVTPGQAAVLYDGEEVLGGGWIEKSG